MDGHRGEGAHAGAGDLALGQDAEPHHEFLVTGGLWIGAAQLRDPHGDHVVGEERRHDGELGAVEGAFTGADDDDEGVEVAVGLGGLGQEGGWPWCPPPSGGGPFRDAVGR
ncbi:hypothetical protein [Streptomyces halobius]|uniref:Uncharacterized protein n=1 Tax=Streptomyces halobius TaxID=2879846 RepID=A0ABY4MK16_9ACTN|nr:hypothetical protein [Streptomyces halobius]UQA98181.1 hypothetical protein K9S39_09465 [Streptomyces halobius]